MLRRGLALWSGQLGASRDRHRTGPRIAVIGNCQARGVARSLEILLPEAAVTLVPANRRAPSLKSFAQGLQRYDHVFAQPFAAGHFPDGGSAEFTGLLPQARLFPALVFPAFHPDMVYVGNVAGGSGALVPSPLHTYHSAIALFGYLNGLSEERIVALFREDVFARLGFLDGWGLAADDLVQTSRAIGFDLGPELLRWARRGAFMHGINHPKLFVMADIARRLAAEAGLSPVALPVEAYLGDDLLDEVIWPVYPAVAAVYGLNGSYAFKRRALPNTAPSVLDLAGLVAESLALYRTMPKARLTCHRITYWSGSPEIRALFDAA